MNPPTDVGKKDLPQVLKARFSEIYVDELESIDELGQFVAGYTSSTCSTLCSSSRASSDKNLKPVSNHILFFQFPVLRT